MRKFLAILLLFLSLLFLVEESCTSSNQGRRKPHGKIPKKGKIPCPIKDC
ncbi:MAG: hypothetical protein NZ551_03595 [Microscillaceae bacterium]|nr:hypothetical protein [Microscillaceae bacterium]MDW8460272.1 hypothetical protein [Cytophagales bacterium]